MADLTVQAPYEGAIIAGFEFAGKLIDQDKELLAGCSPAVRAELLDVRAKAQIAGGKIFEGIILDPIVALIDLAKGEVK